ncbi:SDR family oxidoreductase [Streptomyces sp. NPDC050625]|uniref:SDR family NAD(P)-dependent oxidoreductase n=1 Tax=Streptomyces sp. NPDC050625 TaxID=3154629 RepID=UPI003417455F
MTGARFEGKRVVVVGSGFGIDGFDDIGRASAAAFAREGAEVAVVQVTKEMADECVTDIAAKGGVAHAYKSDPRDPAEIVAVAEQISERWSSVDVLVTHHFATTIASVENTTREEFEEALRVNLTGAFVTTKSFLPALRAAERASIVHAGSIDGILGNPNIPAYSASKGGVHALVHCLAGELGSSGIRVNGIGRAGSTALPLAPQVFAELDYATPMGPAADPAEYAAAVLFLASNEASYINGVILPVDGGRTAVTPGTAPGYAGYAPRA